MNRPHDDAKLYKLHNETTKVFSLCILASPSSTLVRDQFKRRLGFT